MFTPFGISHYGAPGTHANSLMEQFVSRIVRNLELSEPQVTKALWGCISSSLMSSVGSSMLKRWESLHDDGALADAAGLFDDVLPLDFFDQYKGDQVTVCG